MRCPSALDQREAVDSHAFGNSSARGASAPTRRHPRRRASPRRPRTGRRTPRCWPASRPAVARRSPPRRAMRPDARTQNRRAPRPDRRSSWSRLESPEKSSNLICMDTGFPSQDAQSDFGRARRRAVGSGLARRLRREPGDVNVILPFDEVVAALGRKGERASRPEDDRPRLDRRNRRQDPRVRPQLPPHLAQGQAPVAAHRRGDATRRVACLRSRSIGSPTCISSRTAITGFRSRATSGSR